MTGESFSDNSTFIKNINLDFNDLSDVNGLPIVAKKSQEIYDKIYTDQTTGLPNRNRLTEDIKNIKNPEDTFVCYCDINLLKKVNDEFSHEAGDRMLKKMADFLKTVFPKDNNNEIGDWYRIGGDEFVGVFQTKKNDVAASIRKKLISNSSKEVDEIDPENLPLSFAVGLVKYDQKKDNGNLFNTINRGESIMKQNKKHLQDQNPNLKRP